MSRRRRAVLLLGLAVVLGGLAASDVARRESALEERLGAQVPALVARGAIPAGTRVTPGRITRRAFPARFLPAGAIASPAEVIGLRTAVDVPAGGYLSPGLFDRGDEGAGGPAGPGVRPGERVAQVVALGSPDLIPPGSRVDVLVTREPYQGARGETVLALEDVEILEAAPGPAEGEQGGQKVSASLRVTLRQAVFLAAAQSFARELRLLPRAPGDRGHGQAGLAVDAGLG